MCEHEGTLPTPDILAYTMSEAVADQEAEPETYLQRFMDELFQLEPGLRQHFSDALLGELKEEIRRDQGTLSGYPIACIEKVERAWEEQS